MPRVRRSASILALFVGLALFVSPFAYSMFDRTADLERILDRFEFLTLSDNPQRYLDEAVTTRSGSTELVEDAIPGLAARSGVSERDLERRFPALARAQREIPQARAFSIRYSAQLEAVDDKFDSVYDVPATWLPVTATPWLFLIGGLAFGVAGVVGLRTTGSGAIVAIGLLGLTTVVGLLAFSAPTKAADGEDVKDFASKGLTAKAATAAQRASTALDEVVEETEERTLPYLARGQGVSKARIGQELASNYPAAGEFLADWDTIGPNLSRLADAVSASEHEFQSAKGVPIAAPVWLLLGAGAVASGAAGLTLLTDRRRSDGHDGAAGRGV